MLNESPSSAAEENEQALFAWLENLRKNPRIEIRRCINVTPAQM